MQITVELSLYPLKEAYTEVIIDFINAIKLYSGITIRTTAMSTYLSGDYDVILDALRIELKKVYQKVPDSSTVIKIIPKDLNIEQGYLSF